MRVLPALEDADGLALVELDAAIDAARARYTRRILLLEGFFARERAARDRAAPARHCGARQEQVRMLENGGARAPARGVRQGQHRDEPARASVPTSVAGVCQRLSSSPSVAALRLMTHFARADEDDGLDGAARGVRGGVPGPAVSALARQFRGRHPLSPRSAATIVRPGIMLYGATPFPYDTAEMLGPAAGDDAALGDHRRAGAQGQRERRATARRTPRRAPHRIGVVACGYADGYPRHAPNGTPVLVCGKKVRIAGRPSMDMLTVDLTDVPEARVGSPVVLWGEGLPVDDVASAASTVGYELLCAVAPRVPLVTSEVGGIDLEL